MVLYQNHSRALFTDIHKIPYSLAGLTQQHESLCSNTVTVITK